MVYRLQNPVAIIKAPMLSPLCELFMQKFAFQIVNDGSGANDVEPCQNIVNLLIAPKPH